MLSRSSNGSPIESNTPREPARLSSVRESRKAFRANGSLAAKWGAQELRASVRASRHSRHSYRNQDGSPSQPARASHDGFRRASIRSIGGLDRSAHHGENASNKMQMDYRECEKSLFRQQTRIMVVSVVSLLLAVVINETCASGDYRTEMPSLEEQVF